MARRSSLVWCQTCRMALEWSTSPLRDLRTEESTEMVCSANTLLVLTSCGCFSHRRQWQVGSILKLRRWWPNHRCGWTRKGPNQRAPSSARIGSYSVRKIPSIARFVSSKVYLGNVLGEGNVYSNFKWVGPIGSTFGSINQGQKFSKKASFDRWSC